MAKTYKIIIGRTELVAFPELLMDTVPAKTDTGAYRSAIHAEDIEVLTKKGKKFLKFSLLKNHPNSAYDREVETPNFKKAIVENSFGEKQERYVVTLKVKVGPRVSKTEFTLADRTRKAYPILLGRTLTNGRFLVDSSQSNIDRKKLQTLHINLPEDSEVSDPA